MRHLCFQQALRVETCSFLLLSFQLCDSMGFFSCIVIQLHHEGWVVPDSRHATVQWLRKSSWEIADSGLSPSPKEDTEPRFLLSGLNSGHHLPFFLVKVCAASPSLQTQPSSQGQFQLNLTSCVQKKSQKLQLTSTMTAPAQGSSTIYDWKRTSWFTSSQELQWILSIFCLEAGTETQ